MKSPKCRLCDAHHYSYEPHQFAINKTDDAINKRLTNAINRRSDQRSACEGIGSGLVQVTQAEAVSGSDRLGGGAPETRSANRRTKEAYNAYMKQYMKKRRMKDGSNHR